MLEDTNSLDGAQMENIRITFTVLCREKLTIVNIMFSEMKIHDVKHVDVYKNDNEIQEETIPWITGCDVLEDGNIILCDCENKVIKLLTETFDVKETLTVEDNPWDVSVLNSCDAMITLPWLRKLSILHVDPTLGIGNTVAKFEKKCWGVCVIDCEIYVTLHNEPGEGEVRVVDFKGTQIKRLGVNQDKTYTFDTPGYVTVSKSSGKIYVSDSFPNSVTCLTSDGKVVYQYKDGDLKKPRGLIVDFKNNIIVCGRISGNIQILTDSGNKQRTLLTSNDGLTKPLSLAFNVSSKKK